jgi:hypothetical protein
MQVLMHALPEAQQDMMQTLYTRKCPVPCSASSALLTNQSLCRMQFVVSQIEEEFPDECRLYRRTPHDSLLDTIFSAVSRTLQIANDATCPAKHLQHRREALRHFRHAILALILPLFKTEGFLVRSPVLCNILRRELGFSYGSDAHAPCCRADGADPNRMFRERPQNQATWSLRRYLQTHRYLRHTNWTVDVNERVAHLASHSDAYIASMLPVLPDIDPPVGSAAYRLWRSDSRAE